MALPATTIATAAPRSSIVTTTNTALQVTTTDNSSVTAGQKRSTTAAGNTNGSNFRPVKRRASKACQCCRARKVRCNVVEHGAPCTNCRLDEVECIITESKRRKCVLNYSYCPPIIYLSLPFCSRKLWGTKVDNTGSASDTGADTTAQAQTNVSPSGRKTNACHNTESHTGISGSPSALPIDVPSDKECSGHVPHLICAFKTPVYSKIKIKKSLS